MSGILLPSDILGMSVSEDEIFKKTFEQGTSLIEKLVKRKVVTGI